MRLPTLLTGCAALFLQLSGASAVEIVAHRGASHDAPENTVSAFKLGWEQGADLVELDVYLSKDGEIVAMHDKDTKRTAGVAKPVVAQTLEELRALDVGKWKGAKWAGERVPTMSDVIATIPEGKRLFIEIKCGPEILPKLKQVLDASGRDKKHFEVIAFNYDVMKQGKELMPEIRMHWLVAPKKNQPVPSVEEMIAKAKAAKVDGLNLSKEFPIDQEFAKKIKDAGLNFYVWTVNDAEHAKRLVEAGVEGIATDRPGWLRAKLQE